MIYDFPVYNRRIDVFFRRSIDHGRFGIVIRERLQGLSPQKKLEQGFAVVTKENGERILSVSQTETGDMLRIYLRDGFADVSVIRKGSLEET